MSPNMTQLPCQLARQTLEAQLARYLLFASGQLYERRPMPRTHDFDLAVVVDDDPDIALAARLALRGQFREIVALGHPKELLPYLDNGAPDVILLDLNFERGATDGAEGFRWLPRILNKDPDAAIVIITAHGGLTIAVDAIKRGAADFVTKPWSNERLVATVRSAASLRASKRATQTERSRAVAIGTPVGDIPMIGKSSAMRRVNSLIERAAPTDANVLILGENGTGKELVARELHLRSRRSGEAMVSVDLGAVSESLVEIELPPLRNRRDDIPLLLDHYLALYERKYGTPKRTLEADLVAVLSDYDWPGNVRALRHATERAVILAEGDQYRLDDFPLPRRGRGEPAPNIAFALSGENLNLDRAERQMVERALRKHHYNISLAAAELGLTRTSLYRRMEKHGL